MATDLLTKYIFLSENVQIPIKIWLRFVPIGPINNISALVQIMVRRRPADKSLSEPMMVNLLMHVFVTQSQWVNTRDFFCLHSLSENTSEVISNYIPVICWSWIKN